MQKILSINEWSSLNEIGDSYTPTNFTGPVDKDELIWYFFKTPKGIEYEVVMYLEDNSVDVSFRRQGGQIDEILNNFEISIILSTIIEICKDFLDKYTEVKFLTFCGVKKDKKDPIKGASTRTKLYLAYLKHNLPPKWSIKDYKYGNQIEVAVKK